MILSESCRRFDDVVSAWAYTREESKCRKTGVLTCVCVCVCVTGVRWWGLSEVCESVSCINDGRSCVWDSDRAHESTYVANIRGGWVLVTVECAVETIATIYVSVTHWLDIVTYHVTSIYDRTEQCSTSLHYAALHHLVSYHTVLVSIFTTPSLWSGRDRGHQCHPWCRHLGTSISSEINVNIDISISINIMEVATKQECHLSVLQNDRWDQLLPLLCIRQKCFMRIPKHRCVVLNSTISISNSIPIWATSVLAERPAPFEESRLVVYLVFPLKHEQLSVQFGVFEGHFVLLRRYMGCRHHLIHSHKRFHIINMEMGSDYLHW